MPPYGAPAVFVLLANNGDDLQGCTVLRASHVMSVMGICNDGTWGILELRYCFALTESPSSRGSGSGRSLSFVHEKCSSCAMRSSSHSLADSRQWKAVGAKRAALSTPSFPARASARVSCLLLSSPPAITNSPPIKRSVKTSGTEPLHFFTSHTTHHTAYRHNELSSRLHPGQGYVAWSQLSAAASAAIVAFPNAY